MRIVTFGEAIDTIEVGEVAVLLTYSKNFNEFLLDEGIIYQVSKGFRIDPKDDTLVTFAGNKEPRVVIDREARYALMSEEEYNKIGKAWVTDKEES